MARLTVGDRVVVNAPLYGITDEHGTIREDDDTDDMPYKVDFDVLEGKGNLWLTKKQVQPERDSRFYHIPGKPVTSFEVGKWYTWFGMNNGKPTECINLRNGGRSGDFLDKYDGHKIGIGLPDNSIREVPAPSQGHMHTMPRTSSPYSDDVVCGEPRTGKHTVSIYPYRIQSVDVRPWTVLFKMARPVATRSEIRRRLLNLE